MVSNCLMNKINDDSELQSFLQLKLNLFLKNCFYLKVRLPQSQRFPLRYLYFAASFTIWSDAGNMLTVRFRKYDFENLVKCGEYIVRKLNLSNCIGTGNREANGESSNSLQQVGWLKFKKKQEYLFTKWCVENSVLSKLLLKTHLSIEWSLCFIYLEWGQEASKDVYKS